MNEYISGHEYGEEYLSGSWFMQLSSLYQSIACLDYSRNREKKEKEDIWRMNWVDYSLKYAGVK